MKSHLFLVLAMLFWAGNYVVGHAAVDAIPPLHLTALRWAIAVVPLFAISHLVERPDWRAAWRQWPLLLVLAALGLAGYNLLLYFALEHTSALDASLINGANPALLALMAALAFRERLRPLGWLGLGLGLIGVVVVLSDGRVLELFDRAPNAGDALMLGAITVWSLYTLAGRRLRGVPPITATAIQALFAVLGLAPIAVATGVELPSDPGPLSALFYIAIFASIGSYVLWNTAVRSVPPARAGIYLNLMVPFTALIGLAFGASISLVQIVGGVLVVGGVVLTSARAGSREAVPRALRSAKS